MTTTERYKARQERRRLETLALYAFKKAVESLEKNILFGRRQSGNPSRDTRHLFYQETLASGTLP